MIDNFELVLRLFLAAVLGGIVGLERERAHKVAGLRTHALVSIGAALLSILSLYGFSGVPFGENSDPSRLIANIIVGIGFIGGGAILRQGSRILGTTTAASLWLVAAVGIAVGMGFIYAAVVTAILTYIILTILWRVEKKFFKPVNYSRDTIRAEEDPSDDLEQ